MTQMTRQRTLIDPASGKTWATRCEGATLVMLAGAAGKDKRSEKPQADEAAALTLALKEERSRLKKGFILVDPEAPSGSPRMHRWIGGGYTGALAVGDWDGDLVCNHFDDATEGDELQRIAGNADVLDRVALPSQRLAWKVRYAPAIERLLVLADHSVLTWNGDTRTFEVLCPENSRPASVLALSGGSGARVAFYREDLLVVRDLLTARDLLSHPVEAEMVGGHTPQMQAALSADGGLLACCAHTGEVLLFDLTSGQPMPSWRGEFEMIEQLAFSPDGRWLLAREQYGRWALHCFDLTRRRHRSVRPGHDESAAALIDRPRRQALRHHLGRSAIDRGAHRLRLCQPVRRRLRRTIAIDARHRAFSPPAMAQSLGFFFGRCQSA